MGLRGEEDMVLSQVRMMEMRGTVWEVESASSYSVLEIAIVLMRREVKRSTLVRNGLSALLFEMRG